MLNNHKSIAKQLIIVIYFPISSYLCTRFLKSSAKSRLIVHIKSNFNFKKTFN